MENIKILYNENKIKITPFDDKDEVMLSLKDYLESYIDTFKRDFEINIEINNGKVKSNLVGIDSVVSVNFSANLKYDIITSIDNILDMHDIRKSLEEVLSCEYTETDDFLYDGE